MRNEVYVNEKSWVTGSKDIETDRYDDFSSTSAVTNEYGEVVASLRTTDSMYDWLAEDCFNEVFKPHIKYLRVPGNKEVSRLCIDKDYRNNILGNQVSVLDFLTPGILLENSNNGIRGFVVVTHTTLYVLFKINGMKITMLSKFEKMADGCKIAVFYIDVEESIRTFRPLKYIEHLE
ncbi:MAG: acyl-homoserine-lactone synthase [Sedimenticola sp.]